LLLPAFASFAPSVSIEAESRATIATASSNKLVRVHHRATTHQNPHAA
jgi:hypothetical protein